MKKNIEKRSISVDSLYKKNTGRLKKRVHFDLKKNFERAQLLNFQHELSAARWTTYLPPLKNRTREFSNERRLQSGRATIVLYNIIMFGLMNVDFKYYIYLCVYIVVTMLKR